MARRKLSTAHYLHTVEQTEWEQVETTMTGKQLRKRFPVPTFIDIGATVATPNTGQGDDIEFLGTPTPDMVPLDDEAQAYSDKMAEIWRQGEYGVGTEAVLNNLSKQMATAMATGQPFTGSVSVVGVKPEEVAELRSTVKALMDQNAAMMAAMLNAKEERRR